MLGWLASLVSGPIVGAVVDGYRAKLAAGNDRDRLAVDLAAKEIAARQEDRRTLNQWGPLSILMFGFGAVVLFYFAKVIIWDISLGLGTTPAIKGDVARWVDIVIQWLFGVGGGVTALRMVLARLGR